MNGLGGVLLTAAASGEDLGRVTDIITDSLSAFGKSASFANEMGDILAATSSSSNTTISQLGESFKMAAPLAGALGFSVQDTSLALGLMANAGIKASMSGTTLRAIMSKLADPTGDAAATLNQLGVATQNSDGTMRELSQIIDDLRAGFAQLTPAQKAQAASAIGGQEAMGGLLAIMNAGQADVDKLSESINNSAGSAQAMADVMEGGMGGAMRSLKSATEGLFIAFGDVMAPAVIKLTSLLKIIVNWFTQLSGTAKAVILVLGGIAAAIGPVLVGLGFLASTIIPAMVAGFAALFSPVTLVIAAVAALAAAALYVADNWDVLKERISNFGVIFKNAIIDLVQFLLKNNPIQLLIKPYEYLLGLLGIEVPNPFEMISDSLDQFRGEVKENTKQFGSFGQAVKNAFTGAKKDIESVDKAENNLIKTTENLTTTVQGLGFSFKETFGNLASEMELANAISIHSPFKNLNEDLKELNPKLLTADQLMQGNTAAMNAMSEETLEFATAWQALSLKDQNALLNDMFSIINSATGAFQTLFSTMLGGGDILKAVGNMIKQLVAKMLAMAAAAAILSIITGGTSALAGGITSAFGGGGFGTIFKGLLGFESFAEGGMVTGQTMAMVGDNPSGKEAIIPFEKMGSFINMATGGMGAKSVHVEVTGRVTGEDIILAGNNFTNSKTRRLGF
jgi:TP901 family phage tail tape measure protein